MTVLLLADHDNKTLSPNVAKALSAAKAMGHANGLTHLQAPASSTWVK